MNNLETAIVSTTGIYLFCSNYGLMRSLAKNNSAIDSCSRVNLQVGMTSGAMLGLLHIVNAYYSNKN